MRKPSATAILSVLLALSWIGFLASSPHAQEAEKPQVQKWEYMDREPLNNAIEKAGDQGWEGYAVCRNPVGSTRATT